MVDALRLGSQKGLLVFRAQGVLCGHSTGCAWNKSHAHFAFKMTYDRFDVVWTRWK